MIRDDGAAMDVASEAPASEAPASAAGAGRKPLPGSIVIRPSRNDAERSDADFAELIYTVRTQVALPNEKIAELVGNKTLNPRSSTSRKFKSGFTDDEKRKVLKHIFEDKNWLSGKTRGELEKIPDALYFAFLNFMSTRETSQDNARASIVGTYKLWRFSVEHEDEFVLGKLEFAEDPVTRAIKATMTQPKKPTQGVRGSVESFTGYFFRMSDVYLLWLRDDRNEEFRITLFPRFKFDEVGVGDEDNPGNPKSVFAGRRRHLIHLDGFGLGIDGNSGFFSPVHLSLVDDVDELATLDGQLDVLPDGHDDLPERIVKKLKRNGPLRRL